MLKRYRYIVLTRGLIPLVHSLVSVYSATFRLTVENEAPWRRHLAEGGRVILCAWHQQFFAAMRPFRAYAPLRPCLMISKSRDGDIIASVAERYGWRAVRGSSTRGGREALREIVAHLGQSRLAGHIVDGPRGPAGIVKPGIVSLAHATGAVIVPFYTSADRAWHFRSWDAFLLPKPFARVRLRFGEMIRLPALDREEDFERQRAHIQALMQPELIAVAPTPPRDERETEISKSP